MDTADQKITRRASVESQHNQLRDARERQFVEDKAALEQDYQRDLVELRRNKEAALSAVGLNPDGGDPQERPQG